MLCTLALLVKCWPVAVAQELTDLERRQQLQVALETLKRTIPQYSLAAQNYIKHPSSQEAKVGVCSLEVYLELKE